MNFLNKLKQHFESTPTEDLQKEWEQTKELDNVGETMDSFMERTTNKLRCSGCEHWERSKGNKKWGVCSQINFVTASNDGKQVNIKTPQWGVCGNFSVKKFGKTE